jgi:hypothetical protein
MARRISLEPHLTIQELAGRYRSTKVPVESSRWHFIRKTCKPELETDDKLLYGALGRSSIGSLSVDMDFAQLYWHFGPRAFRES